MYIYRKTSIHVLYVAYKSNAIKLNVNLHKLLPEFEAGESALVIYKVNICSFFHLILMSASLRRGHLNKYDFIFYFILII